MTRCGQLVGAGKKHAVAMAHDYLFTFQQTKTDAFAASLVDRKLSMAEYLRLQSPAVEWLLREVGADAARDTFTGVLTQCVPAALRVAPCRALSFL